MSFTFQLCCPVCKGKKVDTVSEPQTLDDFIGAPCATCGYVFTEKEIQGQLDAAVAKRFDDLISE